MKRKRKLLIIFSIILLFVLFSFKLDKVLEQYGQTVLKNTVYEQVNNGIKDYLQSNVKLFDGLVIHEHNECGNIAAIKLDGGKLGVLQSGLESEILASVKNIGATGISVPIGNLSGSALLSGRGPYIKIQTVPLTTVSCDTVNKFESVGINHTMHKLGLVFTVSFKAAYPFGDTVFENSFNVTLCESIIIGEVPIVYVN